MRPAIGLTMGDPAGIGPEIIQDALHKLQGKLKSDVVVIGPQSLFPAVIQAEFIWKGEQLETQAGVESHSSGFMALQALQQSVDLVREGRIQGIVNAPVSKKTISFHIPDFVGQTGYYAHELGSDTEVVMSFLGQQFALSLLTHHMPLKQVSDALMNLPLKEMLLTSLHGFEAILDQKLRAVVCGVNPHAGEEGLLDCGADAHLQAVVSELTREGYPIEGPLPGDSVFTPQSLEGFNLVIAAHHDQGLAPFKAFHPQSGLGVSLGLKALRMTVDHGTAFDIAGKSRASSQSMEDALMAMDRALIRQYQLC